MSENKSSKNLDQVRDESEAMSQEVECTSENKSSENEDESNAETLAPMDEEWNGEVVAVKIQKNFEGSELELMVMGDLKECPHTVNVRDRVLYRKYLHSDVTEEPSETSAIVMDYCSRGMLFRYPEAKGKRCGTPGYSAPEISSEAQYSSKVDIYSAGVILFEMLYGYNPELGIEEKRVFREKSTRWTKWLIKRGVLNLEKSDSAQRLLKYLDGSNIRTPFILIWENGRETKRKACYKTEEAVRILEEKGGGVRYGIYRLTGMELIDAMMEATPENRWDIDDVRGHEFVADAPDYNEEELKGMLDDMDREINRDATLRENERKQKEKLENLDSKKMFRSTGAAGKDDCPFFNVLKLLKLEDDYDGIIKNIEKIGKRVPYRPESALIKCLTMFKYKDDPEETLGRLICIFEKTWKVVVHKDVESYSIRVICDKANFPDVDALLTVFWDEKKEVSIVEFRNLISSYFEFQHFFEGVRSEYF
eukprot:jgi/Bigna1/91125/estExt_fgenesh1_pg.C_890043